jgi:hypothetical protein
MPAMTLKRYRRPPGRLAWDHVLAGAVNRALADLEGIASLPQVASPTQMIAGVPVPSAPPTRDRFLWVQIDSPGVTPSAEPFYDAWHEVEDQGDGTFAPTPDGLTGSPSLLAFEANDREAPVGAVVPAWVSGDDPQSVTFEYSPPPEPLTVREVVGTSVSPVTVIEFDPVTGLKVTDETGGVARVENLDASPTQTGVVNKVFQRFAGLKWFEDSIQVQAQGGAGALIAFTDENGSDFIGQLEGFGPGLLLGLRLVNNLGTTLNTARLTPSGFNVTAGVYQIGGANGQTVTDSGVTYTGGIRTGGTLAVPGSSLSGTVDGGSW